MTALSLGLGLGIGAGTSTANPGPINQHEIHGFLFESREAVQHCNAQWVEGSMLPSLIISYHAPGRSPVTLTRAQYLQLFRERCRQSYQWGTQAFGHAALSVRVRPHHTEVEGVLERGPMAEFYIALHVLRMTPESVQIVRVKHVFVRGADGKPAMKQSDYFVDVGGF